MKNLTKITAPKFDVIFDLRYASTNNVCAQKLYAYEFCYLHEAAIEPLQRAILAAKNLGLKIKIFDAFRPVEVQKFMFKKFSDGDFISNPVSGSIPHCRGVAIDLTLCDLHGNELEMGTDFDDFSDLASHNCSKISSEAQRNRLILLGLMTISGFDYYSKEWWHYQLFNPREYEVVKTAQGMVAV